jgi:hypothetical protein
MSPFSRASRPQEFPDAQPPRSGQCDPRIGMDAVQQANSGHPGMPMGMADIAEVLWNDFLRHNPNDPAGSIATVSC